MPSYLLEDNDLVQTNLFMELNGQTLMNTFHWIFKPTGGPADGPLALQALNNALIIDATGYILLALPRMTDQLSLGFLTSQKIKPDRWRAEKQFVGGTGTNTGDPLPQNVAVSLERWPLVARRGTTGRVQVPGIVVDDVDAGKLTNTSYVQFNIVAQSLAKTYTITPGDFVPVLAHLTPGGYSVNQVVGAEAKIETRTMRRRTVGRGI